MTGNLNTPGQAALFRNTCCFCDRAAFSHPSHGQEPCVADYPYAKIYLVRKSVSTERSRSKRMQDEDWRSATFNGSLTTERGPAAIGENSVGQRPPLRRHPLGTALRQRKDRKRRV
jgi:hypothetical protein